jgi:hypothetical protein
MEKNDRYDKPTKMQWESGSGAIPIIAQAECEKLLILEVGKGRLWSKNGQDTVHKVLKLQSLNTFVKNKIANVKLWYRWFDESTSRKKAIIDGILKNNSLLILANTFLNNQYPYLNK